MRNHPQPPSQTPASPRARRSVDTASCAEATGRHRDLFEEPEGGAKHFLEDPQCLATATRVAGLRVVDVAPATSYPKRPRVPEPSTLGKAVSVSTFRPRVVLWLCCDL